MRKALASFAIALSAVAATMASVAPAFAQEAQPGSVVISPPSPVVIRHASPQDPRVTNADFFAAFDAAVLEGFDICREAAREHREFEPARYTELDWSVSRSGPATNVEGNPYHSIELQHFPDIRLDIRQYADFAECSVMTLVLDMEHAAHLQERVEAGWDAELLDEGDRKDEIIESESRSWGERIDVRHYDLFFDDEFAFGIRHMVVTGTPIFLLETTPIEHLVIDLVPEVQDDE